MKKPRRKLSAAEKAEKRRRREEYMTIFINGKQKRIKLPPAVEGLDVDEFIRRNADPIWLHQNGMWEYMTEGEFSEEPMSFWDKCPICGGDLEKKVVEKLLRGGNHTAVLQIQAEVCFHCRERLYPEETVKLFEKIRNKLERQDFSGFEPLGQAFTVDKEWISLAIRPAADSVG